MKFKIYLSLLIIAILSFPFESFGFSSVIGLSSGYDDNVDATADPEGAFFARTYLDFSHQTLHQKAFGESLLYLNGSYKKYFGLKDTMDLTVGGHYSCFPLEGRLMTLGFIEGGLFRDSENPLDDFNRGKTGVQLKYYYNSKLTFDYLQTMMGRSFLEQVEFTEETASGTSPGSGGSTASETIIKEDQDDLLISSDFGMTIDIAPWLTLHLSAMFSRLFPSIEEDSYDEGGCSVSVTLVPAESWSVTMGNFELQKKYTTIDGRDDRFTSSGLIITKITDNFELFISADFMKNNSSIYEESYKQRVTQCGISLFF